MSDVLVLGAAALATGLFGLLGARKAAQSAKEGDVPALPWSPVKGALGSPTKMCNADPLLSWVQIAFGPAYLNMTCAQWQNLSTDQKRSQLVTKLALASNIPGRTRWIINQQGQRSTLAQAASGNPDIFAMLDLLDEYCALTNSPRWNAT